MDKQTEEWLQRLVGSLPLEKFGGDIVAYKHVEYEIGNVEDGGIGVKVEVHGTEGEVHEKDTESVVVSEAESPDDAASHALRERVMGVAHACDALVADAFKEQYSLLWDDLLSLPGLLPAMAAVTPHGFKGGYNQKLLCNLLGALKERGIFGSATLEMLNDACSPGKRVKTYLCNWRFAEGYSDSVLTRPLEVAVMDVIARHLAT